mgnify:FL=1|tara:strand:- start:68 stop:331 length:264 start_codon:yes stop_codon:yes gene_type:complete
MSHINEKTKINLTPKNLLFIIGLVTTFVSMYFKLHAEVEDAKRLPARDVQVDAAIIKTSNEIEFIKSEIVEMKSQLQVMEQRLYQLQ